MQKTFLRTTQDARTGKTHVLWTQTSNKEVHLLSIQQARLCIGFFFFFLGGGIGEVFRHQISVTKHTFPSVPPPLPPPHTVIKRLSWGQRWAGGWCLECTTTHTKSPKYPLGTLPGHWAPAYLMGVNSWWPKCQLQRLVRHSLLSFLAERVFSS